MKRSNLWDEEVFLNHIEGQVHIGASDQKGGRVYNIAFFSRKVTYMFTFQKNAIFTFAQLVSKRYNINNSLRD